MGGPCPWSCGSTVAIRHSNPYFSAVKYLHFRRCVIVTTLNKASVLDEIWVLARLDPPNNNWARLTMKPKWNLLGEKSLIIAPIWLLSYWFKWCPHTDSNRGPTDYKSVAHKNSHHSSIGIPFANKSNQAIFSDDPISLRYTWKPIWT